MSQDTEMQDPPPLTSTQQQQQTPKSHGKSHTLFTTTLKSPTHAYAHLELVTDSPTQATSLDNLQVRSYMTAALRQFMGDHGAAVAIDILKVDGRECWLRLPRQDLSLFAAAITAYPGIAMAGGTGVFRVLACGNWLGSLVGRDGEGEVWGS